MVSNVSRYIDSEQGNFWRANKGALILYLNVSLNTILGTDIYFALEEGLLLPSISYSGPAERVQLVTCRLTSFYPAKEYHHYWTPTHPQQISLEPFLNPIVEGCQRGLPWTC